MDANTTAYRWTRFHDVLARLELTDEDCWNDSVAPSDAILRQQESAIREFPIGDEAIDQWIDEIPSPQSH